MTTDQIRLTLNKFLDKDVVIKYNLGRNKYEKYHATIKKLYKNVFIVEIKESKIKIEL